MVAASSAESLGRDAVGAAWPSAAVSPSAAASQLAGDDDTATGVWVEVVARAAAGVGFLVAA